MNTTTLCQVCQSATAEYHCERCGTMVCSHHYDTELGLCTACAADVSGGDHPD